MMLCAAGLLALMVASVAHAAEAPFVGQSLEEALHRLQDAGLELVFTTGLVRPEMRVGSEPKAREPRAVLDEILAPHGLAAREAPGGRVVIVPAAARGGESESPTGAPGTAPELLAMPVTEEVIDVTSSRPWVLGDGISALSFGRDELVALPRVGEDVIRSATLLPGTSGNDVSARFSVRGGRQDEVMLRLDGLEILEPFHLKDFGEVLSILAPKTLGRVELYTGGFSAEFGDRMGGVLDMSTFSPRWRHRTELGLSTLDAQLGSSGTWGQDGGEWLLSLRGGALELPSRISEGIETPEFGDALGKLTLPLRPGQSLRGNALFSYDQLVFSTVESKEDTAVVEKFQTRYANVYGWLHHDAILSPDLLVTSRASWSRISRDRQGSETGGDDGFDLRDHRELDVGGLAQDWTWRLDDRRSLRFGADGRSLDVAYDYLGQREGDGAFSTRFDERFTGQQYALYVSDRWQPGARWTFDLGLRWDENTITDAERLSPRLSGAFTLSPQTRLRFAWGYYSQSQRLYELQVEDGETRFAKDELAEHWGLGVERVFERGGTADRQPLTLRAELYRRRVTDPRVRYENLFDPISIVPELEVDRVRIAPESSLAQGIELFLGGSAGHRFDWFASYTYSSTEDRLEGRDVPRSIDQPHNLVLDLGYHAPHRWEVNLAWTLHSGWPTTAVRAEGATAADGGTEIVQALGPLNAERLPAYRRLDLRLSRRFRLRRGELTVYVDTQNLANTRNVRGFDVHLETRPDGSVELVKEEKYWAGILPTAGLSWSF